ncbi:alpha/beta hydrolase [Clostridium hydrogenum]|uniref:alpha/beta hydrolase n=1 Tax=Clostridium hydrogenum TaxID=2855764 RepID=UPI001F436BA9|nr:alpha/beta hydrolase family protein [Clostridium hydrogenum]
MAKFNCNVISYTLKRAVDITVIIPTPSIPESLGFSKYKPSHKPVEKYPVLYLLHGMGNNHATWCGYSNVELFAEERNIAVVMLSGENKAYINNTASGDRFYDFIEDELPEFICGMFPISDKPEHTYIAGLSMGGFGTLVHALSCPEKFCAFGAFSAAISLNPADITGGEDKEIDPKYDPLTLAINLAKAGKRFPKAYIACGEKDFLYKANVDFVKQLSEMGVEVNWVSVPNYQHEWRFWNLQIEAFLDWIPRTDFYAKLGKRQI